MFGTEAITFLSTFHSQRAESQFEPKGAESQVLSENESNAREKAYNEIREGGTWWYTSVILVFGDSVSKT